MAFWTDDVLEVVRVLKQGGLAVFPTDTVWGLGVAASNHEAIERFYTIKRRESTKPTAVLVADLTQAERLGDFGEKARNLASQYWPGALTVVVKARAGVPKIIRGSGETVGLRVPDDEQTRVLCEELEDGIVTGSANFAGGIAPREVDQLDSELLRQVDVALRGEAGGTVASTVVDTTVTPFRIVRQGPVRIAEGDPSAAWRVTHSTGSGQASRQARSG